MANLELDYWKYKPERWLLSDKVRKMKHVAISGYRFLCDNCMMQALPGICPDDEQVLIDWSRLSEREWALHKESILANFVIYLDKNGVKTWHHEYIKGLYREFHKQNYDRSNAGKFAVSHRKSKNRKFSVEIQPYTDPYQAYTKFVYKEVSNEVTYSAQPPAPSEAAAGGVETIADGDGVGSIPIGRHLQQQLAKARHG